MTPLVIAGPCLFESLEQAIKIAEFIKGEGGDVFRAKPFRMEGTRKPKENMP